MTYQGHIENGHVIFDEPVTLPDGTEVRVEAVAPARADFWQSSSLEELSRRQENIQPRPGEDICGGWPDDELDDGFAEALLRWRDVELEQGR